MNEQPPRPAGPVDRPMFWAPSLAFVKWAIAIILGGCAVFMIVLLVTAPEQLRTARGAGPAVLSLVAAAAWTLLARGRIEASVYLLGAGLWAYVTGISLFLGGLNSMAIIGYPVIIIMFGWLLGPRAAAALTVLTVAATFGFLQGELLGALPPRPPTTPALMWIFQVPIFILSAVLITYVVRSYRNRIEEVRKLGSELALRTAEVQAREADLNRAQAVAHVGSWAYERASDVLHLSAETCRIFGLPEGTRGSHASYLARVHPEDRGAVERAWRAALEGGASFDSEHRILVGDAVRWVRQLADLEFDAQGTPLRSVGTTQDVTERKRAEEALRLTRIGVDAASDAIFWIAPDARIVDANAAASRALGYTREELLHLRVSDIDIDFDAHRWPQHFAELRQRGSITFESRHRTKDGRLFPVEIVASHVQIGAEERDCAFVRDVSERKRHETEVLAARNQLAATLDAIPDLLFEVGLDGRFHDYHSPRSEFLLASPADFLGKTISEILPPGAADVAMSALRDAQETGRSQGKQYELELAHGKYWFELSVSRKPVAAGQQPRFIVLSRDVTGRKQAEEELRKRNAFVESLLENAPIGFAVNTIDDGQQVFVGRNFEHIYGLAPGSIDGTTDFFEKVYLDPVQREKMRARVMADLASGDAARMRWENIPIRTQAGENKVVTAVNIPLPEQNLMISTVQDVTEHKRTEHEYRTVIQASTDGFWVTDTAGRILDANSSICQMLGYTRDELLRLAIRDIDADESPDEVAARTRGLMQAGSAQFQARHRRKDGAVIDVEVSVQYVAALGERLFAFVRDITGRKQAEARQAELEAQLRESQKMEALGTLAGGVAHDFNNIVATIMGNVELALQDVGPGHAAGESLEEIRKASRRAKDMVQQILAFGRRQVLERRVIALAPVVEESVSLLRSTLPAGVSLSVECAPDAPAVLADATQVQQVLLNLCANAWQAMQGQERPGTIEVSLALHVANGLPNTGPERRSRGGHVALRPGRYSCLTVRDNGPGMDQATRARMFEPFFTTKPVGKGTGLGLAVVHGIVQDHGASIAVHSAPGEGAALRIYFPASQQAAEAVPETQAQPRPAPSEAGETLVLHAQGKSILYIDDDEAIVFLMTRLLQRQGYHVSVYTDPRDALAAVRAQPDAFDLVVTDYNMPGMSGLEVARALREIRADLPVALASGYITDELRAQAPAAGVKELIYKPNTVDELCAVIARVANTLSI